MRDNGKRVKIGTITKARNGNSALEVVNIMKHAWSTVRWTLDRFLRLAAAATALVAIPSALIGGLAVDRAATTSGLIVGLSIMVFGFLIAFSLLVASVAFWPDKSKKLKTPALVLLSTIYVTGICGLSVAGAGFIGFAYAKAHGFHIPARVNTELVRHSS